MWDESRAKLQEEVNGMVEWDWTAESNAGDEMNMC